MIYLLRRHPLQLLVAQHLRQQQQQQQPEPGVNIDHANMATVPGHSVVPSSQPCQVSLRGHWKVGTSVVVAVVVAVAVSNSSLRIAFGHLPSSLCSLLVLLGYIYYDFKVPSRQLFVADFYKL